MKTVTFLVMLSLCLNLAATTMVIVKDNDSLITTSVTSIDSIYFADDDICNDVVELRIGEGGSMGIPELPPYTTIRVDLLNVYGDYVMESMPVNFSFASTPPEGANLNHLVYGIGETVTVNSVYGQACVSLNGGTGSGYAEVQASVDCEDHAITVSDNFYLHDDHLQQITLLRTGEPHEAENNRTDLPISFLCLNDEGDPIHTGEALWFSISDPDIDWCTIERCCWAGNSNEYVDSVAGVAHSILTYESSYSMQEVPITVEAFGIEEHFTVELQTFEPHMYIIPLPGHLDWTESSDFDYVEGEIQIQVVNGQGCSVRNAIIFLSSELGNFVEPEEEYQVPDLGWNFVNTNQQGVARARIQFNHYECPPVDNPPNEVSSLITGYLVSTNIFNSTTVILLNYNEPE